jgi:predicted PolB exonuclease-like 3'-5' exonuclease
MLKSVAKEVWAFDAEWVPDAASGRRAYDLADTERDEAVLRTMWARGGATHDDPHPYLKTMLCRVVSIAAVIRKVGKDGNISLALRSLPAAEAPAASEAEIIARFLEGVGKTQPQLVGFNSRSADLVILLQRAMVNRLSLSDFCRRPAKPWEGIDYFARGSEAHLDLKEEFGGWGRATPSLHEFATACGIPGKTLADGHSVADLWPAGELRTIVQYNECDALSTYLLWLRAALLTGQFTAEQHEQEERRVWDLLERRAEADGHEHLAEYLETWLRLRGAEPAPAPVAAFA